MALASGFEVKKYRGTRRVRCKNVENEWVPVISLSDLPGIRDLSSLQGLARAKAKEGARNWTTFFLHHEIWLKGNLDCANLLKDREPDSAVYVKADWSFPYFQTEDRVVKGTVQGPLDGNSWIIRVHLDHSGNEIDLKAYTLYFISGDLAEQVAMRTCGICNRHHDIRSTPCPKVMTFVSTDRSRCPPKAVDAHMGGDAVLTVSEGQSMLRSAGFELFLCDACRQRAAEAGNRWFRLDGLCEDCDCLNHATCSCIDDVVNCSDYVYMDCCTKNNLPWNEIASAIADGTVRAVAGARWVRWAVHNGAVVAKSMIYKAMKSGQPISVSDVAKATRLYEEEILVLAMHDRKLGDYLKGNKCFTLSIVNGYVENAGPRSVGPWLVGRIVKDSQGQMWHVPKHEAIVVETRDGVAHVRRSRKGDLTQSDALGEYIAGF